MDRVRVRVFVRPLSGFFGYVIVQGGNLNLLAGFCTLLGERLRALAQPSALCTLAILQSALCLF